MSDFPIKFHTLRSAEVLPIGLILEFDNVEGIEPKQYLTYDMVNGVRVKVIAAIPPGFVWGSPIYNKVLCELPAVSGMDVRHLAPGVKYFITKKQIT